MTGTVKRFCLLPLFFFNFATGIADATPVVIACHNCTNGQYKSAAENAIPMYFAPGRYDIYIVDRPKSVLKRFLVTAEREPGFTFNYAKTRAPAVAYQQEFDNNIALLDQLDTLISEQDSVYELPENFAIGSASEVYNNILAQNTFNQYFNSRFSFTKAVAVIISIADVIWDIHYLMDVRFPDGSIATYKIYRINDNSENRVEWEYVPGSARDSENNRIPEQYGDFDNFHALYDTRASWYNLQLFINAAINWGIPVTPFSGNGIVAVVCIAGAGGTLCEIQYYDSAN